MRIFLSFVVLLAVSVCLSGQPLVQVSVPFQFGLAEKTLPPGDYLIIRAGSYPQVMKVEGKDPQHTVLFVANSLSKYSHPLKPVITFRKYGEKYFLAEVIADFGSASVKKSKAEREFVSSKLKWASTNKPELVIIAGRR